MSKQTTQRTIYVYANWEAETEPVQIGMLQAERVRGKEIFSFEYNPDWIRSSKIQLLDPDLQFYTGTQYLNNEKNNFGLFLDSSPDRWGRVLMRRREAAYARLEERPERR